MMDDTVFGPDDFLGVARSLTGRRWRARPVEASLVRELQSRHGLAEPLARAMAARGISSDGAEAFLRPTLKALFPDPSSFAGMDEAAAVLVDALGAARSMVVFADYDVDGASSAALLVRWFRHMGAEVPIYVPDRLAEGYGPSPEAFRRSWSSTITSCARRPHSAAWWSTRTVRTALPARVCWRRPE